MTRGALYAQAIRGPLVLITIGALFAMHQAGVIRFSRTWPLIIIVIGIIKLVERLLQPAPLVPPQFQGGPYPQQGAYQPQNQYPPTGGPRV